MARVLRYGVIGCGMMGQEHLRNIALLEGTEVAAVFEPDARMRQQAAALAPQASLCDSLEALLAEPSLDCLLIASPNYLHATQLAQISAIRPLPVLVEKPLYIHADERATIEALDAYPAPVWVAMEYRYMPPIAALLQVAQAQTGGVQMLTIREHRFPFLSKVGHWNRFNRYSGGTLVEKCCHFFDLMRLILGDEPLRISASVGQAVNHLDECYDGTVPDIDDHGYVLLDFPGGRRAMLELCMFAEGARYQEEISVVGPLGKVEALVPGPSRFWPPELDLPVPQLVISPRAPKGPVTQALPVPAELLAAGDHNGATFYQHQRFADLLRRRQGVPEVSWQDGAAAVEIALAAQRAAGEQCVLQRLPQGQWVRA